MKKSRLRNIVLGYALSVGILGSALLIAHFAGSIGPNAAEYIFLAAVVFAAWFGGKGPGLFAAILTPIVFDYFFIPPLYTLDFHREAWPYVAPLSLAAIGAAWLCGARAQAKNALLQVEQIKERFRKILLHLPDIPWTANAGGRILYVSPKCEELTGFHHDAFYEGGLQLVLERVHPDDLSRLEKAIEELFAHRAPFDIEFRFQKKDGTWVWLHNRAIGGYQEGSDVVADGVINDVSARKAAEIELQSKKALLEAQVNATIDGILIVDTQGQKILQNKRFLDLLRIPAALRDGSLDAPILEHATGLMKDRTAFLERIDYLYQHPMESSREQLELKDGTILDRYSAPVLDDSKNYLGRIWTFRDITEQKRFEETLKQLALAMDQSPASVVITDPEGYITYVNRKFSELTGYPVDEVLGKNPRFLNSGKTPRDTYKSLWDTIKSGHPWHGEFQNKKKNGELFTEAAVIAPIFDSNGVITHFLATKEDITERLAIEAQLRQAHKLEGIGQLAAGVAHEINTPTQFISDNLTFLRDAWEATTSILDQYRKSLRVCEDAIPREVIDEINEAEERCNFEFIASEAPRAIDQGLIGTSRVSSIVRAMKEFSHPESNEMRPIDLNRAIEATIAVSRGEWKHVAQMETILDASLPTIVGHSGEINQVILNLIVNAAHAIAAKNQTGSFGKITVSTRSSSGFAELAIADSGTGIPEDIRSRVFEPFFTTKELGKGTGQGLAMAYSIVVKKYHGKIWFKTETGVGTTFFVRLPFRPEDGHEPGAC